MLAHRRAASVRAWRSTICARAAGGSSGCTIAVIVVCAVDGLAFDWVRFSKTFDQRWTLAPEGTPFYQVVGEWRSMMTNVFENHGAIGCDEEAPLQRALVLDEGPKPQARLEDADRRAHRGRALDAEPRRARPRSAGAGASSASTRTGTSTGRSTARAEVDPRRAQAGARQGRRPPRRARRPPAATRSRSSTGRARSSSVRWSDALAIPLAVAAWIFARRRRRRPRRGTDGIAHRLGCGIMSHSARDGRRRRTVDAGGSPAPCSGSAPAQTPTVLDRRRRSSAARDHLGATRRGRATASSPPTTAPSALDPHARRARLHGAARPHDADASPAGRCSPSSSTTRSCRARRRRRASRGVRQALDSAPPARPPTPALARQPRSSACARTPGHSTRLPRQSLAPRGCASVGGDAAATAQPRRAQARAMVPEPCRGEPLPRSPIRTCGQPLALLRRENDGRSQVSCDRAVAWPALSARRSAALGPLAPAADQRAHAPVAHLLQVVGRHRRAEAAAAVEDELLVLVGHLGDDVALDDAAADVLGTARRGRRATRRLRGTSMRRNLSPRSCRARHVVDGAFADAALGVVDEGQELFRMVHVGLYSLDGAR